MNCYKITQDGNLIGYFNTETTCRIVGITSYNFYKHGYAKKSEFERQGYKVKKLTAEEIEKAEQAEKRIVKETPKEETPLDIIIRMLKENGNTNLTKEELVYLPQLEKMFDLEVKHFPTSKQRSICKLADENARSVEDWIITLKG